MTESRLQELLDALSRKTVVVTGDFCLDRYGLGRLHGVSRETGQEVRRLENHFFSPGAAGTIAWNLVDLGARVIAVAALGGDRYGEVIRREMELRGIETSRCVVDETRHTPSYEKLRFRHANGEVRELRLDVANPGPVGDAATEQLLANLRCALGGADAFVVADYDEDGTGVITPWVREQVCALAASSDYVSVATSRAHTAAFRNFVLVPNEFELTTASGVADPGVFDDLSDQTVEAAAARLLPLTGKALFVTRGTRGITVYEPGGTTSPVPTRAVEGEVDITGAGDSALSALTMALAAGGSVVEAATLGNMAANVTVRKLGTTGTASPAELRQVYRDAFAEAR